MMTRTKTEPASFTISWRSLKRFLNRILIGKPDACWVWQGEPTEDGYGLFRLNGQQELAHRVAWKIANGQDVPPGLVIRHSCDYGLCVNPAHLLSGTQLDNVADRHKRGRDPRNYGEANGRAKLNRRTARKAKRLLAEGKPRKLVANICKVSLTTVDRIFRGERWQQA